MKTIGVVAPGIESKKITAATTFNDEPINLGGYKPKNYTGRFQGYMTVKHGIEISENIPMIKALQEIGIETSYEFLKKMDLPVTESDKSLGSLALGGLTYGFTVQDMAGAYAMIANDGEYIKPTYILRMEDRKGEEIYKHNPEEKKKKLMSKEAAYIVKNILQEVVKGPSGTSPYAGVPGIDVAAKTGTTNDDKDRWLVGFTPKYAGAVWYGFDDPETVVYRGANPAGQIFGSTMKELHKGDKNLRFEIPKGLVRAEVCNVSGKKPTALCSRDPRGSRVITEYFLPGTEPKDSCDIHIEVEVCKNSGLLPSKNCSKESLEKRVFIKQNGATEDAKYRPPTAICDKCDKEAEERRKEEQKLIDLVNSVFTNLSSLTISDIEKLEKAINAYNTLSEEGKAKLKEEAKKGLENAKAKLEELKNKKKAEMEKVKEVINLINELPKPSEITPANLLTLTPKVRRIKTKYSAIYETLKKEVTNYSKLVEVENKMKELS